jgi:hypothetical protein
MNMPPTPENIEDVSPYSLLRNFSKNRLLSCLFLALLIHALVIGGLSSSYIYRTWIDPEVALPQPDPDSGDEGMAPDPEDGTSGEPATDGSDPAADADDGSRETAEDAPGEAPGEAPVIDRVTGKADPDQIPDEPGGLGLSIDDVKE